MTTWLNITDPDRVSYRVRILRNGQLISTMYNDVYETALDLGYGELEVREFFDRDPRVLYAALLEEGVRFEGREGQAAIFVPNRQLREGLVRDKALLNKVDTKFLFGLT